MQTTFFPTVVLVVVLTPISFSVLMLCEDKMSTKKQSACEFCDSLKRCKEDTEYYRRANDRSVTEYTAALVSRNYLDGYSIGQFTHYGFSLNFCPVCGKTLMEKKYENDSKGEK